MRGHRRRLDTANADLERRSEARSDFAAPAAVNSDVIADLLAGDRTLLRPARSIPMTG
jgi:hypothetical protein